MKMKQRLYNIEWDAIAGILAATTAIILHLFHVVDEHIILPIVLALIALLFLNFIRHTHRNEHTAGQVERTQKMVERIKSSLSLPEVTLIGPRRLRTANEQFSRDMRGEAVLFNVCLSMYRTQSLFDTLLRPAIENPLVTSIQFVLDENQRDAWQADMLPKIAACDAGGKVEPPHWCTLDKNVSFILADTSARGETEALLSFWGEPFMAKPSELKVPRFMFHVHGHSELVQHLIELDRNCRMRV